MSGLNFCYLLRPPISNRPRRFASALFVSSTFLPILSVSSWGRCSSTGRVTPFPPLTLGSFQRSCALAYLLSFLVFVSLLFPNHNTTQSPTPVGASRSIPVRAVSSFPLRFPFFLSFFLPSRARNYKLNTKLTTKFNDPTTLPHNSPSLSFDLVRCVLITVPTPPPTPSLLLPPLPFFRPTTLRTPPFSSAVDFWLVVAARIPLFVGCVPTVPPFLEVVSCHPPEHLLFFSRTFVPFFLVFFTMICPFRTYTCLPFPPARFLLPLFSLFLFL